MSTRDSKIIKPFNLTICRTCSMFCKNGDMYCGKLCRTNNMCALCNKYRCLPRYDTCQYCNKKTSSYTKIRCLTCQRRCVGQDKFNAEYNTSFFCSKRCNDAPSCNKCSNKVWLDFGENYTLSCLNCLWSLPYTDHSDNVYGRPSRVSMLIKYCNSILVHKRGPDISYAGVTSINSGTMEMKDANSLECVIREMKEEASIDVTTYQIKRLSQTLFYIELTENEFNLLTDSLSSIKPSPGFEYEVDKFGYFFLNREDIKNDDTSISIHLKRSLRVYDRYVSYISKSRQHYNDIWSKQSIVKHQPAKILSDDLVKLLKKYQHMHTNKQIVLDCPKT